jgi:histidine ammonia-lyase
MSGTHTLNTDRDLDGDLIGRVAAGENVTIGPALVRRIGASRTAALAALDRGGLVYGVNTGMGALSGVRLTPDEQRGHQRRLLLGRAAGGPPWLPAAAVRALYAVRLRTFLGGDAGVSAELCTRIAAFLGAGIVPAVPAEGAGSAGEIIQLAHAFGPLAGVGSVLVNGTLRPAADVVPVVMGTGPFELGPKEGIALLAGVPGATALSLLAGARAATVTAMLEAAAGLSIAAAGAPGDPYDPAVARADDVLGAVLARLRGAAGPRAARMLQAPVSFRVAGPVLAQVIRAAAALDGAIRRALDGVTDSPAFLNDQFVGTPGFHGIDLAAQCDYLTAAIAHAAEVSATRLHRLLDPAVTGLSAQLAARPGPDAGLVAVHKRAAGEVHALRRLAQPSALGTIETSGGQEDVQSFAWAAAGALRAALDRAATVAACELLAGAQAAFLARGDQQSLSGCERLLAALAVEPVLADRPLGPDIERLAAGDWLPVVEATARGAP